MPKINPPSSDPIRAFLRAERERRGLSQDDLAWMINRASYQTIWQWESGANSPTIDNLRQWANALGYDVALTPLPT
jgi:transcriptional regulator with XRE-family HTH domain